MIGVVITGHILFASGIESAIKAVVGQAEQVAFVDFKEEYSPNQLKEKIENAITTVDSGEGVIILTDLFGGTPSNVCSGLLQERTNLEVVCGVNLPIAITAVLEREEINLQELTEVLLSPEIVQIRNLRQALQQSSQSTNDQEDPDGI